MIPKGKGWRRRRRPFPILGGTDAARIPDTGHPADHLQTRHDAVRAGVAVADGNAAGGPVRLHVLSTDTPVRRGLRPALPRPVGGRGDVDVRHPRSAQPYLAGDLE